MTNHFPFHPLLFPSLVTLIKTLSFLSIISLPASLFTQQLVVRCSLNPVDAILSMTCVGHPPSYLLSNFFFFACSSFSLYPSLVVLSPPFFFCFVCCRQANSLFFHTRSRSRYYFVLACVLIIVVVKYYAITSHMAKSHKVT